MDACKSRSQPRRCTGDDHRGRGRRSSRDARPATRKRPILRRFLENKLAVAGLVVIVIFYAIAHRRAAHLALPAERIQSRGYRDPAALRRTLARHRPQRARRLCAAGRRRRGSRWRSASWPSLIIMTIGLVLGATPATSAAGWTASSCASPTSCLSIPQILLLISAAALFKAEPDDDDHRHRPHLVARRGAARCAGNSCRCRIRST